MPKAIGEIKSLPMGFKNCCFQTSGVGCVSRFEQVDSVALLVSYPCRILKTPSNCDRNNLAGRLQESSLSETVLSSGRCFSHQLSFVLTPNLVVVSKCFCVFCMFTLIGLLQRLLLLTTVVLFRWVETAKQKKAQCFGITPLGIVGYWIWAGGILPKPSGRRKWVLNSENLQKQLSNLFCLSRGSSLP